MNFRVEWLEPERENIYIRFPETYTWEQLFTAIDDATALLESVHYGVNIVADMRDSQHVPPLSPSNLNRVAYAPTTTHPNSRVIVVIGARLYVRAVYKIFGRLFPRAAAKYRFITTLEDLHPLLENIKEI